MRGKRLERYGEGILDKYGVKLLSAAYRSLEDIYTYIAEELHENQTALKFIDKLEEAIFSLEIIPYRGAKRCVGAMRKKDIVKFSLKILRLSTELMNLRNR